jgi:hypothetical protein
MDKNVKVLIENEYSKVYGNDNKMMKYCLSKTSNGVVLHNGCIFTFDKPLIETSFCFGYDNDQESMDNASNMVEETVKHYSVFLRKNMSQFENIENTLKETNIKAEYSYQGRIKLSSYIYSEYDLDRRYLSQSQLGNFFKLTPEDITLIKNMVSEEKKKFEKRLTTYLNKYGTSKLKVWSYWRD